MKRNLIILGIVLCVLGLGAFGGLVMTQGFASFRTNRTAQVALIAVVGLGYLLIRIGSTRAETS